MDERNEKKQNGLNRLIESAKPFQGGYLLSVVTAVLGVAFHVFPFILISRIIDALFRGEGAISVYGAYLGLMAASYLLEALFSGISVIISHRTCYKTLAAIRNLVLEKMYTLPLGYVKGKPTGELKTLVIDRIESLEPTLAHLIPEMTANLIVPVFVIGYMFVLDWRVPLLSLAILPLGFLLILVTFHNYDENFQKQIHLSKKVNASLVEYVNGLEVIKIFNHGSRSFEKFSDAVEENARFSIEWWNRITYWAAGAQVVWLASLAFVLPAGLLFVNNGSLEPSHFLSLVILTLSWVGPILAASKFTDQISTVKTTAKEIFGLLDEPDLIRQERGLEVLDYSIELKDVHFSYGGYSEDDGGKPKEEILHGISFTVPEKRKIALVGPSGGGKSTIGKLVSGFWDPDQGSIKIGNRNLKELSSDQIGDCISCVDQDIFLFNGTIRENLCLGNGRISEEKMIEAAKAAYCHEFIMGFVDGYETVIGDKGSRLSGGERQRIALARAIIKDSPIIILDEATAYFDPDSEALIDEALSRLTKDKTLLVIAHRLSTIIDAAAILVVEAGSVAAVGTHEELLEKSALYQELWLAHMGAKKIGMEGRTDA